PVTFAAATAHDAVDGDLSAPCSPAPGAVFALGATTVTCTATDVAGNTGSNTFTVTVVDTTGPMVQAPSSVVAAATSASGAPVTFAAATAHDAVDGDLPAPCSRPSGSTFPLGTTTVTCSATDAAGNTGSDSFTVTVQDQAAPVVTPPADTTVEATSASGAPVTFRAATAHDAVDGDLPASCSRPSGSTFSLGTTTVTCSATDAAGNTGSSTFDVTVRDTTAPDFAAPRDVVEEATSAAGAAIDYASPSASDAVDGPTTVPCAPLAGAFPLGATTVTCTAADTAGNTRTKTFTVTVRDTTAPRVTPPADVTEEATSSEGAVVAYGAASADDTVDGGLEASCSPASGSTFALGTTAVTCSATDAAGNTGSSSFHVTVRDTTGPAVTVPANIAAEATSAAGAAVAYSGVSAADVVDGAVVVQCEPASGGTFPLGTTTVACTASDSRGNPGGNSFTVTVVDSTAPLVTVPPTVTAEAGSASGAPVSYGGVSATDAVDGAVAAHCSPASGAGFPLGTTTVTCSATDAAGNTGVNGFDVQVVDTTAPALTVPGPRSATATSSAGAPVSFTTGAIDVVDGPVTPACDHASGSTFALGTTTVTCTATDTAGNTATKAFVVTVAYGWSGVLQPVNADGSSVFKLGSTVPVKFRLAGASSGIGDAVARLLVAKVSDGSAGSEAEAVSTAAATSGNVFRYDASGDLYIFNLATKGLAAGVHLLRIDLGDGATRAVSITLKK
nr:HYR domain-containing protein [Actinomycetota bacterium]